MKLNELCEAYRNSNRWYAFDGSSWGVGTTRARALAEVHVTPGEDPVPNGQCWQLSREIVFRLTGSDPIDSSVPIQNLEELADCTVGDLLVIARCVQVVGRHFS